MSYILEALRKSEQERRRGEMPEINRFENLATEESNKFKIWPVVVVALLVVNLLVLFLWSPWQAENVTEQTVTVTTRATESESSPIITPNNVSASAETPSKLTDNAISIKPKPKNNLSEARQPVASIMESPDIITPSVSKRDPVIANPEPNGSAEAIPAPARTPSTSYLPQLQELSVDLQSQIPDMSFSSHMYSSEPRFRSITINGKRLKEGHYLNDQIQVREITEKGVVLGLDNTLFEVDVLGQWVN